MLRPSAPQTGDGRQSPGARAQLETRDDRIAVGEVENESTAFVTTFREKESSRPSCSALSDEPDELANTLANAAA